MNLVAPYVAKPFASRAMFRLRNLQILLVEDDEADAYLIRRALTANAKVSQVVHAWDGVEALELVDNYDVQSSTAGTDILRCWKRGAVEFLSKRSSATEMAAALDYVISNIL